MESKRWIKTFDNSTEVKESYDNGDILSPYVAYVKSTDTIDWNSFDTSANINYEEIPMTFEILTDGVIKFGGYSWNSALTITYSKDNGETWNEYNENTVVNVVKGDKVQWKGNFKGNGINYFSPFSSGTSLFNLYGNIMSIYDGENFKDIKSFGNPDKYENFASLFEYTKVVDASNFVLPATTLTVNTCYGDMFMNCALLTKAPKVLPAEIVSDYAYASMFNNCRSLQTAPIIKAKELGEAACNNMFYSCYALKTAPEIVATKLGNRACSEMFVECHSLVNAPSILPATTSDFCYQRMFAYCYSLTKAPELPATKLSDVCYQGMFGNCQSLNYIKCLATDISASSCLSGWLYDVSPTGTFVKKAGVNYDTGDSGIPDGWTVIEE